MAEGSKGTKSPQLQALKRVLLVDDNDRYARALTDHLLEAGAGEVVRAHDAAEGVRQLREQGESFDGVISDISMEHQISGLRVLLAARAKGSRRLLAVASTGLDSSVGYALNYVALGLLFRCDYLIPKRPIKREGRIDWLPVGRRRRR